MSSSLSRFFLTVLLSAAVVVAGCGGGGQRDDGGAELTVTATTTHVADLVRNVGGARVQVESLLSADTDPHAYDVRPSDVRAVAESAVVFRSGGDIDAWLGDVVQSAGGDARVVELIDAARTLPGGAYEGEGHAGGEGEHGEDEHGAEDVDPHWWQDPRNAERAVARIRDVLAEADPDGAGAYRRNAAAYSRKLRALDDAVAACWAEVHARDRKLVTTHDALGYYADRYGIEVIGTVIPSLSTQAQASAGRVDALIETIRRERVKAIFAESSVSPRVETAIAREAGAELGRPLWVDALGPAGSGGATYVESIQANTEAMIEGLTGRKCRLPRS